MTAVRKQRRRRRPIYLAALTVLAAGLVVAFTAAAASLPGSNFEIDANANLLRDNAAPSIDWASISAPTEIRQADLATGQNDDSYGGGSKEDDPCPSVGTGSIPNNKSDLLNFGAYVEPQVGGPGFLNLFWNRVTEPSGTTLMDFELNKSGTVCANGVNKVRTVGDILLEYAIDQGGAVATISAREWTGTAWGPSNPLPGRAIGTINTSPILAANSDGLGAMNARTFGEMSLDLDFIFDSGTCESFGSAMVKSRSSDAFTSQLKDFIRPANVNISNCASVIIRKQTDPDEDPNSTNFGYTKNFATSPATLNTFTLQDDGVKTFNGAILGSGYTVTENSVGTGYDFASLNCSASTGVSPSINGATVTFALDSASDVLDCTYTNRARGSIIVEKITDDGQGGFDFTSSTLTPSPFTLTTTGSGDAGKASRTFSNLNPGTYDVAESAKAGWHLVSSSCSDGSSPGSIGISGGETVTCTFHNAQDRGAILIHKLRKHAAGGSGYQPHPGVTFNVNGVPVVTNGNGDACVDNLLLGSYLVTETLPGGYINVGSLEQSVDVVAAGSCASGAAEATFHNMPLTNVSISVDSQIDGGTASSIDCDLDVLDKALAVGDVNAAATDLQPQTIECTIVVDP